MGRPEKAIPDDRPAKSLAEKLRQLRREVGNPSYRVLAERSFTTHNALSQVADGRHVGWKRVLNYIAALRAFQPEAVTNRDLAELRQLHSEAQLQHEAQLQAHGSRASPWRKTSLAGFSQKAVLAKSWQDLCAGQTSTPQVAKAPPPARWNTTEATDWARLSEVTSVDGLVAALKDLVARSRIDLDELKYGYRRTETFSWFSSPKNVWWDTDSDPASVEWLVIEGRKEPTLKIVLDLVRRCGGTEDDCHVWEVIWNRIVTSPGGTVMRPSTSRVFPPSVSSPNTHSYGRTKTRRSEPNRATTSAREAQSRDPLSQLEEFCLARMRAGT